ncbi:MAG: tetratricopeptide repeat protein [Candidatus Xenobiia bacterium LiM19]
MNSGNETSRKKEIILCVLLVTLVTLLAYYPSLLNGFTNWDDDVNVTLNPVIGDLSWNTVNIYFNFLDRSTYYGNCGTKVLYVPLTMMTFNLEYHFFRLNAFFYHLTNLLLHLANCLLVFWLVLKLTRNGLSSLVTSLFFSLHPLHVESVTWITERKDVLYSFFFWLSLITYVYYAEKGNKAYYALSLFLFLLSLLSKPAAAALSVLLFLMDYFLKRPLVKKTVVEKIPFLALTAVFIIITMISSATATSVLGEKHPFDPLYNLCVGSFGFLFYFYRTLYPLQLSCLYPQPADTFGALPLFFKVSPLLMLLSLLPLLLLCRINRTVAFGILFYLITILPASQLIPISAGIASDRYFYVASFGIFFLMGEGVSWLYYQKFGSRKAWRIALVSILLVILGALSVITWERCNVWKDSMTLWNDAVKKQGRQARAYYQRCSTYFDSKQYDKALKDAEEGFRLDYDRAAAHCNRGVAYYFAKNHEKALPDFNEAIRLKPEYSEAYYNRGSLYMDSNEYDKAVEDFNTSLRFNPYYAKAYARRGVVYTKKGDIDKAFADFNEALRLNPYMATAYVNRGSLYMSKGEMDKALSDFSQALKSEPDNEDAHQVRGLLHFRRKEYVKAVEDFTKLIELNKGNSNAYNNRGNAWFSLNDYDKALIDFNEALRLNPGFIEALNNRAVIYYKKRENEHALVDINKALSLNPGYADAYGIRAKIYYAQKEYTKAWSDLKKLQELGGSPNQEFLQKVKSAAEGKSGKIQ